MHACSNEPVETYDVIVIGGGASGLMAAGVAGARGKRVLVLEKNSAVGVKLSYTGGGRCNITNATFDTRAMLAHYGKAEQYLYTPFAQFGVQDTFNFFESLGLPLIVEERQRAFPHTEKAEDVMRVLKSFCERGGVHILTKSSVSRIMTHEGRAIGVELTSGEQYNGESVVLATGGLSRKEMGATGDGFVFLRELGHNVVEPTPTIVPLGVKEKWAKTLSGITLASATIRFYLDGVKKITKKGDILFTHFGISGPLILNTSSAVADLLKAGQVTAEMDAYPTLDIGSLEKQLVTHFDARKNKTLENALREFLPHGLTGGVVALLSTIDMEKRVHSVTKEERKEIVHTLKRMRVTITRLMGFDRAVVADGGVPLDEVDMHTMESKRVARLYITGDLLHINRPSGGFSLQLCWTTGHVAGSAV